MQKIRFYRVDDSYIKMLQNYESKVQFADAANGKERKPFVGILFENNNMKYIVPLSSPKTKHRKMKNGTDFFKINDANNNLLAVLNFNNMIPVYDNLITEIDFAKDKDKNLLQKEYDYCKENIYKIIKRAKDTYKIFFDNIDNLENSKTKEKSICLRCNNFKLLEEVLSSNYGVNLKGVKKGNTQKKQVKTNNDGFHQN